MNKLMPEIKKHALLWAIGAAVFILPLPTDAVTHTVQFGGALGFVYSPSAFSAHVGDTVLWEGDFSVHPISSTSVPTGALPWNNSSGSTFKYVIKVAGTYEYHCDFHFSAGMTGSFTAAESAVVPGRSPAKKDPITFRIVTSGRNTFIRLYGQTDGVVSGSIFTLSGKKLASFADTRIGPWGYTIPLHRAGQEKIVMQINYPTHKRSETIF